MEEDDLGLEYTETTNIKFNKKIQSLEVKLNQANSMNKVLKNRIDNLEKVVSVLCEKLNITNQFNCKDDLFSNNIKDKELTWIYSTLLGTSTNDIIKKLNLEKSDTAIAEIYTITDLLNENVLIKTLIDKYNKMISNSNTLNSSISTDNFINTFQSILAKLPHTNMVIYIKDYPNSLNNKYNTTLGFLTGILNEVWGETLIDKFNVVALVLESETYLNSIKTFYKGEQMEIEFENL
jgi:hypothetical protein